MKSTTLSKIAVGSLVSGFLTLVSASGYSLINDPSIPLELKRYSQIERELDSPPNSTLRDLELRSSELINHANTLNTERDKIILDSNFIEIKTKYKSEKENVSDIFSYGLLGGFALSFLGMAGISFLGRRKEVEKIEEDSSQKHNKRYFAT